MAKKIFRKIEIVIEKVDLSALWVPGIGLWTAIFLLYAHWGEDCVFDIHDQLDETICSYVYAAKYLFSGEKFYPEIMGGIPAESMLPSAVLFVPLYRYLPLFWAFLLQFYFVTISAFGGMYGLVKKMTGSSLIALAVGMMFSALPFKPVYGLSVAGVPLCIYCLWNLWDIGEKPGKSWNQKRKILCNLLGICFFGLTTHLVLIGYVIFTYLAVFTGAAVLHDRGIRRKRLFFYLGCICLLLAYVWVNRGLFWQLILNNSGTATHREEFVLNTEGINTLQDIKNMFWYGEKIYTPSFHTKLIPFLLLGTLFAAVLFFITRPSDRQKKLMRAAGVLWGLILTNVLLYAIFCSRPVMMWREKQSGFFHYFQMDRYNWILPGLWWILTGVVLGLVWSSFSGRFKSVKLILFGVILMPTLLILKRESNLYDNINQQNHGSAYTGMPTFQEHFMQDVLALVDRHIGREKSEYRIAHVGFNTAPSQVYGFSTVDGYANTYPLEYKYAFRRVIAPELAKSDYLTAYFDTWGSRVYLFANEEASSLKSYDYAYQNLDYDLEALKALGCEYLLSAHEIKGNLRGIELEGVFETERSIYRVWLYRLTQE